MRLGRRGLITIAAVALSIVVLVLMILYLTAPVQVRMVPSGISAVVYASNGSVIYRYPPGFSGFQFEPNGTILVTFSNGTVINITPGTQGFYREYSIFAMPLKEFMPNSPFIVFPPLPVFSKNMTGWVVINGINVTLTYYNVIYGVIEHNASSYYVIYEWVLDNSTLSKIQALSPIAIKYLPYKWLLIITVEEKVNSTDPIKSVEVTWEGYNAYGQEVSSIVQQINFEYDTSSNIVVWVSGSITCGGAPGYTFYNEIALPNGQVYKGWGDQVTPQVTVDSSSTSVYETTTVYFGINENGYGIYGQVGGVTTSFYPYGSGWTFVEYVGSGDLSSSGFTWVDP